MAIGIICCSNLPAPPICKRRLRDEEEDRARRSIVTRATIGLASAMIGLEMVSSMQGDIAAAEQMTPSSTRPSSYRVAKWSDKRMCPPWRVNSLESIVPENLPRPNSRRRWDNASSGASAAAAVDAPPLKFSGGRFSSDCFSM